MEPAPTSLTWFSSLPDPIDNDISGSELIARIGMAGNALISQFNAARDAGSRRKAPQLDRNRDIVNALVMTAALVNETIELVRANRPALVKLVERAGASRDLIDRMGKLGGGKHPASALLKRARQNLGFHWDADVVAQSVKQFATNKQIVWLEMNASHVPVFTFSFGTLVQALFPELPGQVDQELTKAAISEALSHLDDAIKIVLEFVTASVYGFMKEHAVTRETRVQPLSRKARRGRERHSRRLDD